MAIFFYSWMFRVLQLTYRDAAGLWTKDWLKPLVGMGIKLVFSVLLVNLTGDVIGVLIPTIFVLAAIYFPWEARVLYKDLFQRSWGVYMKKMLRYTAINLLGVLASGLVCISVAPGNSLMTFLLRLAMICVIFPGTWVVLTWKTPEFKYLLNLAKKLLGRKFRK